MAEQYPTEAEIQAVIDRVIARWRPLLDRLADHE